MKRKVLIVTGYYLPSVKGGGPIQSIKNIVENLTDDFDFYVMASDRDLGDKKPFEHIITDKWFRVGAAHVLYTNQKKLTWKKMQTIMNSIDYEVLYLNSFFSYNYSVKPLLLQKVNKIAKTKTIIATRGEFSPGALNLKRSKKKIFIKLSKMLKIHKEIVWHATAESERNDIESTMGITKDIIVANNLTENYQNLQYGKRFHKKKGELYIAFISRVHPKKNLLKAIEFLKDIEGDIHFNIYGPIEDENYWKKCKEQISQLNSNIKTCYLGSIPHEEVRNAFSINHTFLFPTLGENFGHVISEALIGGCPVIISDQTPWKNLETSGIGWDIRLENEAEFIAAIRSCVSMDNEKYQKISKEAFEYSKRVSNQSEEIFQTKMLFSLEN